MTERPVSLDRYSNMAFLGAEWGNVELVKKIDVTADKVQRILNPIDEVAKRKVNGEATKMISDLAQPGEWKAESVMVLIETVDDKNRTVNKQVAEERLSLLANSTYIAMKYGGNEEIARTLESGSVTDIESLLPEAMKGIGERVRNIEITNPEIRRILSVLDKKVRVLKAAGKAGEGKLRENLENAIEELSEIEGLDAKGDEEVMRVSAYLGWEMSQLGETTTGSNPSNENEPLLKELKAIREGDEKRLAQEMEMFQVQAENQARQLKLAKEAEATTYNTWLSVIIGKSGQTALPSAMWAYEPAEYFDGSGADWNSFLDTVTDWSNKTMTRRAMLGSARDIGKAYFDQSYPKLQERYFALTYNDERSGLRSALEFIVKDLYVETLTSPDGKIRAITEVEKGNGVRGVFAMKYNVEGVGAVEQEGALVMSASGDGGRREYLVRAANKLIDSGVTDNVDYARMMASQALDFLELGFGMDGPDHMRKCNFATEGARTKSRPGYKFIVKSEGGEVFSGSWTAYYQERYSDEIEVRLRHVRQQDWDEKKENDERNAIMVQMAKRDGLIPQVLCGSILDVNVQTERGEMSWGRALSNGLTLDLNESSTEDLLFRIDKWFENASSFWDYVSGTNKLDFKGGIKEVDTVLREFAKDLNNSYMYLRDEKGLVGVNQLIGAMGGASGLVPSEPMILNVPVAVNAGTTYTFLMSTMLDHMPGLRKSEMSEVRRRLGVDQPISNKLLTWWESSKDGRLSLGQRESWRRRLLNKPANAYEAGYRKLAEK